MRSSLFSKNDAEAYIITHGKRFCSLNTGKEEHCESPIMRFQLHLQANARGVGNATVSFNRTKNFGIATFLLAVGFFSITVCAPL